MSRAFHVTATLKCSPAKTGSQTDQQTTQTAWHTDRQTDRQAWQTDRKDRHGRQTDRQSPRHTRNEEDKKSTRAAAKNPLPLPFPHRGCRRLPPRPRNRGRQAREACQPALLPAPPPRRRLRPCRCPSSTPAGCTCCCARCRRSAPCGVTAGQHSTRAANVRGEGHRGGKGKDNDDDEEEEEEEEEEVTRCLLGHREKGACFLAWECCGSCSGTSGADTPLPPHHHRNSFFFCFSKRPRTTLTKRQNKQKAKAGQPASEPRGVRGRALRRSYKVTASNCPKADKNLKN